MTTSKERITETILPQDKVADRTLKNSILIRQTLEELKVGMDIVNEGIKRSRININNPPGPDLSDLRPRTENECIKIATKYKGDSKQYDKDQDINVIMKIMKQTGFFKYFKERETYLGETE